MLDYETSMRIGAQNYRHVTDALARAGWPAVFTQTGGMNLALQITLEGGHEVLITDVDDCLSWEPSGNQGWGVGFYADPERPELGDGVLVYETTTTTDVAGLADLVRTVVKAGTRQLMRHHGAPALRASQASQPMRSVATPSRRAR